MKKDIIRSAIVFSVLLVLYHLVVFLVPFRQEAVFWISYVFTLVAFLVVAVALFLAFGRGEDATSRFYGFPIARLGGLYGLAQLVVGLAAMALGQWIAWWIMVLIYGIGLGATVIGLLGVETVTDQIRQQDVKLKKDVAVMRSLQSKMGQVLAQTTDPQVKRFAEALRYSDPVSSVATAEAERELTALVDELVAAVVDGESETAAALCVNATAVLAERDRLCKLGK